MGHVTLEQARHAKTKLVQELRGYPEVSGIGISKQDDDYAVRVNLSDPPDAEMPVAVDGVQIEYAVVGKVLKRPFVR